jgi:excisionase family DNA binding protein
VSAMSRALLAELAGDPEALGELARALAPLLGAAQPPAVDQRALTVAEAAQLAACHPETIRRAARDGRLPALRVGRAIRVRAADVDAWLAAGTTRDAPAPRASGSPAARASRPMAEALRAARPR